MKLTVIESPWQANDYFTVDQHRLYLQHCIADSLSRGEAPFASHQMYTEALDDNDPAQRELGINAGCAWGSRASLVAVYQDFGLSPGMKAAIAVYQLLNIPIEYRTLPHRLVDALKNDRE